MKLGEWRSRRAKAGSTPDDTASATPAPTSPHTPPLSAPGGAHSLTHRASTPEQTTPVRPALEPRRALLLRWPRPRSRPRHATHRTTGEPGYRPVLVLTLGWYAIPAAFYLVWLVTLDGTQQRLTGGYLVADLPWLAAALSLSLLLAALLQRSTVGWHRLTLSFAATVLGAGILTIAHSLVR